MEYEPHQLITICQAIATSDDKELAMIDRNRAGHLLADLKILRKDIDLAVARLSHRLWSD